MIYPGVVVPVPWSEVLSWLEPLTWAGPISFLIITNS